MSPRRLTTLAILASLAFHLIALPPVVSHLMSESPLETEEIREVVMPLAEWLAPDIAVDDVPNEEPEPDYIRTTANQESLTSPEKPDFVSDRNTRLATPAPSDPNALERMPSLDGADRQTLEVESRTFRDGPLLDESPSTRPPQPPVERSTPPPSPPAGGEVSANEISTPLPPLEDAIPLTPSIPDTPAMPSETPAEVPGEVQEEASTEENKQAPPSIAESAPSTVPVPPNQREAFQSETRRNELKGRSDTVGDPAFEAKATAVGRYRKELWTAIERVWRRKIVTNGDFMTYAFIRVQFSVDVHGRPANVRVVKARGNAVLTDLTIEAILEADIPKMPTQVAEFLDEGNLPCDCTFQID